MDTKELIKRVKRIELKSKKKASNLFMGEYHSAFKGRGMIFSEVRPYQYGDDVRAIDWNKTAHFNEPYVKVFEEERENTLLLMVDASGSESFGTKKQLKKDTIAEICATLAFSAITYNDKVALVLYTDQVELYIPPKKGKVHVLRIIRELLNFEPNSSQTNLNNSLDYVLRTFKRKSNVFILSDFVDQSAYEKNLRILSKKHEVTGIRIYDIREKDIPNMGLIYFTDAETGELSLIDTSSKKVRNYYAGFFRQMEDYYLNTFKEAGAGALNLQSDKDYVQPLLNYFKSI